MLLYRLIRPLLFRLDAERAHELGTRALRLLAAMPALARRLEARHRPADGRLAQTLLGRDFPAPLGCAAGFDKDGAVVAALPALGFGFAEIGTVTPRPQPGNPRPRLFRYPEAESLQNRLGFNNAGADALARRLDALPPELRSRFPLGVNLGRNKDRDAPAQARADYLGLVEAFGPRADYLVINVSSPNTPGLRQLQSEEFLGPLLAAARELTATPLLVKIAPDLEEAQAVDLAARVVEAGAAGVIATNTTVDHSLLPGCQPEGGLSGRVLRERSRRIFRAVARELFGRAVLVSVGGIDSAAEAYRRLRAGASLVQLYSALVFHGPGLPGRIHHGLLELLERDGLGSVAAAVGADLEGAGR